MLLELLVMLLLLLVMRLSPGGLAGLLTRRRR